MVLFGDDYQLPAMEANKTVKIGAHEQDVTDLSQVGNNECPQGESVEANIVVVSIHARDMRTSNHSENKQHIKMAVHLQASFPSLVEIVAPRCSTLLVMCVRNAYKVIHQMFMLFTAFTQHHNTIHKNYLANYDLIL
jgi:hypothetical protein